MQSLAGGSRIFLRGLMLLVWPLQASANIVPTLVVRAYRASPKHFQPNLIHYSKSLTLPPSSLREWEGSSAEGVQECPATTTLASPQESGSTGWARSGGPERGGCRWLRLSSRPVIAVSPASRGVWFRPRNTFHPLSRGKCRGATRFCGNYGAPREIKESRIGARRRLHFPELIGT